MHKSFLILLVFAISLSAIGQQDSLRMHKADSAFIKADSFLNKAQRSIDKRLNKMDSVQNKVSAKLNSLSHITLPDSLTQGAGKYNQRLDSIKHKLTHRIDSLKGLNLSTEKYAHLLDSIAGAGPLKNVKEAEAKLAALQTKVNQPVTSANNSISKFSSKINAPLNDLRKEGMDLPPGLNVPALPSATLGNSLPGADVNLPKANLPGVDNPLRGIDGNIPGRDKLTIDGKGLPDSNILPNVDGLADVQKEIGKAGQAAGEAGGYLKEAKDIGKGDLSNTENLSKRAEQEVAKLEEVNGLQNEVKVFDEYKDKAAMAGNPEEMKKLAEQEIKKEAINHFAGKEEMLKQAMGELEKYKLKFPNATTISDITKPVRNEMHHTPFIERIVPGISLQVSSKNDFVLDVNPLVGYRISGKWTAGIGWVERFQFHKVNKLVPEGRIYGPRMFTDIKWKKGFCFRAEVESINVYVAPPNASASVEGSRTWSWGVFAGVKKDYKIAKGVNGNIQILYKVDKPQFYKNPYSDKIHVRLGMEFPLKKKTTRK